MTYLLIRKLNKINTINTQPTTQSTQSTRSTMLLRSGKIKHNNSKCYACKEYYGNKKFKYKCYRCYKNLPDIYPWRKPCFREQVNQWAKNELAKTSRAQVNMIIKKVISTCYTRMESSHKLLDVTIKNIHREMQESGNSLYLSAKEGAHILRHIGIDCEQKSHIICPLVLDWWNMKKYNYNSTELCYFGRYGDEIEFEERIKSIPPPKPNPGFMF